MDKHAQRIDIFNSTLDLIGQGWYMASDGSKVKLPPVGEVMAAAKMYSDRFTYFRLLSGDRTADRIPVFP